MFKILSRNNEWCCNAVYFDESGLELDPCQGQLSRESDETIKCQKCQLEWSPDDIEA